MLSAQISQEKRIRQRHFPETVPFLPEQLDLSRAFHGQGAVDSSCYGKNEELVECNCGSLKNWEARPIPTLVINQANGKEQSKKIKRL